MGAPPMQPPMGGNVIPMRGMAPPQMVPNPEFAQWQKVAQARALVVAKNAAKQKQFDDAVALIRKDGVTGFRLDIESDSTIALDEAQDRTDRTEFISALLPLLQQIVPIAQGNPEAAEFGKELVQFGVRSFPVARGMEESIDRMFDALAGMPPPQPKGAQGKAPADPALEKAKIEADVGNVKTQSATDAAIAAGKEQTARMAILQKQQAAEGQQHIAEMKVQSEQQRSYVDLAIQASESQHKQDMAGHKAAADAAKGME
jgi:hypothetical protein